MEIIIIIMIMIILVVVVVVVAVVVVIIIIIFSILFQCCLNPLLADSRTGVPRCGSSRRGTRRVLRKLEYYKGLKH